MKAKNRTKFSKSTKDGRSGKRNILHLQSLKKKEQQNIKKLKKMFFEETVI